MKKSIAFLMGLAGMLSITSCSSEEPGQNNPEGTNLFQVVIPSDAIQSRSYGNGAGCPNMTLFYSVFLKDLTGSYGYATDGQVTGFTTNDNGVTYTTTLSLPLVKDENYKIVFFAADPSVCKEASSQQAMSAAYLWNATAPELHVNYSNITPNQDVMDAFYGMIEQVGGQPSQTVTLKRPFGQVNLASAELDSDLGSSSYGPGGANLTSSLKIKKEHLLTNLNLLTGVASGNPTTDVTFASVPKSDQTLSIKGTDYSWLSMIYLLANSDRQMVDCDFTINGASSPVELSIPNVPVQRNYQTNLYGSVLTSDQTWNVEIKPAFDGVEEKDFTLPEIKAKVGDYLYYDGHVEPGETENPALQGLQGVVIYVTPENEPSVLPDNKRNILISIFGCSYAYQDHYREGEWEWNNGWILFADTIAPSYASKWHYPTTQECELYSTQKDIKFSYINYESKKKVETGLYEFIINQINKAYYSENCVGVRPAGINYFSSNAHDIIASGTWAPGTQSYSNLQKALSLSYYCLGGYLHNRDYQERAFLNF